MGSLLKGCCRKLSSQNPFLEASQNIRVQFMISGLASIKVIDNFLSDKETSALLAQLEAGELTRNEVWASWGKRMVLVAVVAILE